METYKIKKVLVPIDFSTVSLNALETAIAICKRQLATLTLIHVVENTYVLLFNRAILPMKFADGLIIKNPTWL